MHIFLLCYTHCSGPLMGPWSVLVGPQDSSHKPGVLGGKLLVGTSVWGT